MYLSKVCDKVYNGIKKAPLTYCEYVRTGHMRRLLRVA